MKTVPLPDFLIVGAAKAGTTSLHHYLALNHEILMSEPKEPKYISYAAVNHPFQGPGDQEVHKNIIKTFHSYSRLFMTSRPVKRRGESSVENLYYHREVIPLILDLLKNPAIVMLLRNPVDRAFSAFTHMKRDNREPYSFEQALELEDERIASGFAFLWHYKKGGLYYEQVKDYLDHFPRCKIFLFEDLKQDAQKVVDETCAFLKVKSNKVHDKTIYNRSGIPLRKWKSLLYNNWIRRDFPLKSSLVSILPVRIKDGLKVRLKEKLLDENLIKAHMLPETRKMLLAYYREDILKLQQLIGRDLSHWLS